MEFLQVFYFLCVKLFTGVLLGITFLVIPLITAVLMYGVWPTKIYQNEELYTRPTAGRLFWLVFIAVVGIIFYGSQLNWIFNMRPSNVFDLTTHNFFEGYEEHLRELEAEKPPVRTNLATELRRYELLSYNPPKHFYVTIEDVKTHSVFKSVYVSKHCNSASKNRIGDEYNIRVTPYTMSNAPGVVYYEFHDLHKVFCGE